MRKGPVNKKILQSFNAKSGNISLNLRRENAKGTRYRQTYVILKIVLRGTSFSRLGPLFVSRRLWINLTMIVVNLVRKIASFGLDYALVSTVFSDFLFVSDQNAKKPI